MHVRTAGMMALFLIVWNTTFFDAYICEKQTGSFSHRNEKGQNMFVLHLLIF